jgi:hypothetical protein
MLAGVITLGWLGCLVVVVAFGAVLGQSGPGKIDEAGFVR